MRCHLHPSNNDEDAKCFATLLIQERIQVSQPAVLLSCLEVQGLPLCMDGSHQLDAPYQGQHGRDRCMDYHPAFPPGTVGELWPHRNDGGKKSRDEESWD